MTGDGRIGLSAVLASSVSLLLVVSSAMAWGASGDQAAELSSRKANAPATAFNEKMDGLIEEAILRGRRVEEESVSDLLDRYLISAGWTGDEFASAEAAEAAYDIASAASAVAPSVVEPLVDVVDAVSDSGLDDGMSLQISEMAASTHTRLINARMFKVAGQFGRRHGIEQPEWTRNLAPYPGRTNAARYLQFDAESASPAASVINPGVESGDWLIIEVHPDCGFSRRAMAYLAENKKILAELVAARIIWLVSQADGQALPSVLRWNDSQPDFEMVLSYRDEQWPRGISFLEYPVFNLVRDGRVVSKLRGWPGDHQGDLLRSHLQDFRGESRR